MAAKKTGIDLSVTSPAEKQIVQAVIEYVGLQKRDGKNASRNVGQIKNISDIRSRLTAAGAPWKAIETVTDPGCRLSQFEPIQNVLPVHHDAQAIPNGFRTAA